MFHPALDLHVHTTVSDGKKSPADVVKTALELGLDAIAITDHDTVGGVEEARRAAEGTPLFVVPGVELSIDLRESCIFWGFSSTRKTRNSVKPWRAFCMADRAARGALSKN